MNTRNKFWDGQPAAVKPLQDAIDALTARVQNLKAAAASIEARLATIEKLRRNENAINFFLAPSKNGHKSFEESLFRKVQ